MLISGNMLRGREVLFCEQQVLVVFTVNEVISQSCNMLKQSVYSVEQYVSS